MSNKLTNVIAVLLLLSSFLISFFSMSNTSLTFDELAHIPAGYSYLKYHDYRINPEHPPLIKLLSSTPLQFLNLNFPEKSQNWIQDENAPAWWVQFDLGNEFIFHSDNNPRQIIFWSRLPMILLFIFLAWFSFRWARKLGGNVVGIITLIFLSFSPTLLAHNRLVTTDIGAALGVVLATYFWLKFLEIPNWKNIFGAILTLGVALLCKFSLILLIPFFFLITLAYALIFEKSEKLKKIGKLFLISFTIGIGALIFVIWPIYSLTAYNYPLSQQLRDTQADLAPNPIPFLKNITLKMTENSYLKPLAQYFRGVLMAGQRTSFGNTVYFLGKMSADGIWYYFPFIYLIKEPIALHLLSFLVLFFLIYYIIKNKKRLSFSNIIRKNFVFFSFAIFLVIYWGTAIVGNLNIGVRHLIPVLPFIFIMTAFGLVKLFSVIKSSQKRKISLTLISFLISWYIVSSLSSFPHFLSYYNEFGGGTSDGYLRAVDSNYDWGQDFYYLKDFVEENNIEEIYIDYFGGEDPKYWLGEKYKKFDPHNIEKMPSGWLAISVNHLMGGLGKPSLKFDQETGYYEWIREHKPVARAGKSIFIYYFN